MPAAAQLLFLLGLVVIFWLILIRPARRQQRLQQDLVDSLSVGDEVVIGAGIFGRITWIEESRVGLEVAPGVVLPVAKQVVVRRLDDDPEVEDRDTLPPGTTEPTDEKN